MTENLHRLDAANVGLLAMDATMPALATLDAVLLDVPCTGTGTFRRHPDARWRLRYSDLALLSAMQAELLRAAAARVNRGGLLVYSTCSLEREENDDQVTAFLEQHPDWRLESPPAGTVPDEVLDQGRLRVLPHVHGTDGSFAARLRRGPAT
jgi:16S rRNA (cytosine967-C5)-methyltransferase